MVAISLYRGNLHRVPDVPRRWLIPTPTISRKDFKVLLCRRNRALYRLNSSSTATTVPTFGPDSNLKREEEALNHDGNSNLEPPVEVKQKDEGLDGGHCVVKATDKTDSSVEEKPVILEKQSEEKTVVPSNEKVEISDKEDVTNDNAIRKKEVEEKLKILNEKKHNLVQMLKRILHAEEELKRRMNVERMTACPPVPFQVDVSNDSGSMTRAITPRMGSEGNLGADMEVGEADDASNSNMHSRNLPRMSSMSPSSDSPHRRGAYNVIPQPSRSTPGAAGSPLPFAPTGKQGGNPPNLPTGSVSGTNYIASSPSPAASGGTSVFRDGRLPSPWN